MRIAERMNRAEYGIAVKYSWVHLHKRWSRYAPNGVVWLQFVFEAVVLRASYFSKTVNLSWKLFRSVAFDRCAHTHTQTDSMGLLPLFFLQHKGLRSRGYLSVWRNWCNGDVSHWKPLVIGVNLCNFYVASWRCSLCLTLCILYQECAIQNEVLRFFSIWTNASFCAWNQQKNLWYSLWASARHRCQPFNC